jgi:hypothetical protein
MEAVIIGVYGVWTKPLGYRQITVDKPYLEEKQKG